VEQTYYRWREEYGGLKVDQARRLKELEQKNAKLKRLVSEMGTSPTTVQKLSQQATLSESPAELLSLGTR